MPRTRCETGCQLGLLLCRKPRDAPAGIFAVEKCCASADLFHEGVLHLAVADGVFAARARLQIFGQADADLFDATVIAGDGDHVSIERGVGFKKCVFDN